MEAAEIQHYKKSFGLRVRSLRKGKGYSQEDFAHECGMHRTYLGGIERGERNVSLENICKIALALHIPVANLFSQNTDSDA